MAALELLHEGPRHPYEIHQTLRERQADQMVKLSAGTLYHSIERLDRDGFIEVVETSREGRRPERTTYRLTQAGRDAFADRLRGMVSTVADEYPEFGVAVELLHTLDQRDAVSQLRTRMISLESLIAAGQVWIDRLTQTGIHPLFWPQVRLRLATMRAELEWITELVTQLESGELGWPDTCGAGRAELRGISE